jgi:hypothetical protein
MERLSFVRDRFEWTAAGENAGSLIIKLKSVRLHRVLSRRTYISVFVRLFGSTFGFCGGITQSEDDRRLVILRHLLQDLGGEGTPDCSGPDQNGRLDRLHHLGESFDGGVILGVGHFVLADSSFGSIFDDQTFRIHHPDLFARLLFRCAFGFHGHGAQSSYAEGGLAGSLKDDRVFREARFRDPKGGQESSNCHAGGALNVIVETAVVVPVFI